MHDVRTIDCHYLDREGFAAAYLIRDGDRAAFVETNTTRAVPHLLAALEDEGLRPEQVELVIITHVHLDHAGGASALMAACPNATLLAHPRAAPHVIDPEKLVTSARAVYGDELFERLYGTIEPLDASRVRTLEDGERVALGDRELEFLHTRGHANHHFCVHDHAAGAIFTGDAFGVIYPHLQKRGRFAVPSTSPTDFDAAEAKASVDRIVASGAEVAYPTHFGPYRDLGDIAAQMHAQLDRYGAIVEDAERDEVPDGELDGFCEARVAAIFESALADAGLSGDPDAEAILATDAELNAQGVAFAIRRARRRAAR